MTRFADVSVAIPTLNRPDRLARCLDAIFSGETLPREVIIVDQGDDDHARAVTARYRTCGASLIYVRQERRGLSASRNAALARAACPIVAVTDDDCVPGPGWIAAIDAAFVDVAPPDIVTGRILPLGPDAPDRYAVSSRTGESAADFRGKVLPWLAGSGGNWAIRRDWFARVGGCDERLGVGSPGRAAEDLELFYRLLRHGATIRYDPRSAVYHERATRDRRLATRWTYGYGIGALCGIWLRQRDLFAVRIFSIWLLWQIRTLLGGLTARRWTPVHEGLRSVQGVILGLGYGLRVGGDAWRGPAATADHP